MLRLPARFLAVTLVLCLIADPLRAWAVRPNELASTPTLLFHAQALSPASDWGLSNYFTLSAAHWHERIHQAFTRGSGLVHEAARSFTPLHYAVAAILLTMGIARGYSGLPVLRTMGQTVPLWDHEKIAPEALQSFTESVIYAALAIVGAVSGIVLIRGMINSMITGHTINLIVLAVTTGLIVARLHHLFPFRLAANIIDGARFLAAVVFFPVYYSYLALRYRRSLALTSHLFYLLLLFERGQWPAQDFEEVLNGPSFRFDRDLISSMIKTPAAVKQFERGLYSENPTQWILSAWTLGIWGETAAHDRLDQLYREGPTDVQPIAARLLDEFWPRPETDGPPRAWFLNQKLPATQPLDLREATVGHNEAAFDRFFLAPPSQPGIHYVTVEGRPDARFAPRGRERRFELAPFGTYVDHHEQPTVLPLIKEIQDILLSMPRKAVLTARTGARSCPLSIEVNIQQAQSDLRLNDQAYVLTLGRDIIPLPREVNAVLLRSWIAETIAAYLLQNYRFLNDSRATNINAALNIEVIKSLLNFKERMAILHHHVYSDEHDPAFYWQTQTFAQEKLQTWYAAELEALLDPIKAFDHSQLFVFLRSPNDVHNFCALYLQWLSHFPVMNDLGSEGTDKVLDRLIADVCGVDVLSKVSLTHLRNMLKMFVAGPPAAQPRTGPATGRAAFEAFDDSRRMAAWQRQLFTTGREKAFYKTWRRLLEYTLPLSGFELDREIARAREQGLFRTPPADRPTLLKNHLRDFLVRWIGTKAMEFMLQYLEHPDQLPSEVPYFDLLQTPTSLTQDADHRAPDEWTTSGHQDWVRQLFPLPSPRQGPSRGGSRARSLVSGPLWTATGGTIGHELGHIAGAFAVVIFSFMLGPVIVSLRVATKILRSPYLRNRWRQQFTMAWQEHMEFTFSYFLWQPAKNGHLAYDFEVDNFDETHIAGKNPGVTIPGLLVEGKTSAWNVSNPYGLARRAAAVVIMAGAICAIPLLWIIGHHAVYIGLLHHIGHAAALIISEYLAVVSISTVLIGLLNYAPRFKNDLRSDRVRMLHALGLSKGRIPHGGRARSLVGGLSQLLSLSTMVSKLTDLFHQKDLLTLAAPEENSSGLLILIVVAFPALYEFLMDHFAPWRPFRAADSRRAHPLSPDSEVIPTEETIQQFVDHYTGIWSAWRDVMRRPEWRERSTRSILSTHFPVLTYNTLYFLLLRLGQIDHRLTGNAESATPHQRDAFADLYTAAQAMLRQHRGAIDEENRQLKLRSALRDADELVAKLQGVVGRNAPLDARILFRTYSGLPYAIRLEIRNPPVTLTAASLDRWADVTGTTPLFLQPEPATLLMDPLTQTPHLLAKTFVQTDHPAHGQQLPLQPDVISFWQKWWPFRPHLKMVRRYFRRDDSQAA